MLDAHEFKKHAEEALTRLHHMLASAGDDYGFDTDFNGEALTVEFEKPAARFVVSPNSPVRQVWVSARSKSYKLEWDEVQGAFVLPSGQTLRELLEEAIGRQLGEEFSL